MESGTQLGYCEILSALGKGFLHQRDEYHLGNLQLAAEPLERQNLLRLQGVSKREDSVTA